MLTLKLDKEEHIEARLPHVLLASSLLKLCMFINFWPAVNVFELITIVLLMANWEYLISQKNLNKEINKKLQNFCIWSLKIQHNISVFSPTDTMGLNTAFSGYFNSHL